MQYSFDFAISFSAESREVARELAKLLVERGARVFYDDYFLAHLLGKRLDSEFSWAFGAGTRYFVPIVSSTYVERSWPQYEWSVAKHEAEKRKEEFILPLRIDDSHLVGLPDNVGYLDLRGRCLNEVAELLLDKLGGARVAMTLPQREQNWVATFGLLIEKLSTEELPPEAPSDYARLCNWLTEELLRRLSQTSLTDLRIIEDARDGETYSIRMSFEWDPSIGPLDFGEMGWWELLELLPYSQLSKSEA